MRAFVSITVLCLFAVVTRGKSVQGDDIFLAAGLIVSGLSRRAS